MSPDVERARALFLAGVQHFESGRLEPAEVAFAAALDLAPGRPSVLTNLGVVRVRLGRFDEALPLLDQALAQEPGNVEALVHRAMALAELDRPVQALRDTERALAVAPAVGKAWGLRGSLLKELGRHDEAAQALQRAIELGSDVDLHRYVLAGIRGDQAPAAPPRAYVEQLFDNYAGGFDAHLTGPLAYQAPRVLLERLQQAGHRFDHAADLGCGTGLCGPWLRSMARQVTGVDVSARMLEQARAKHVYDELVHADLVDYLRGPVGPFDLVVAADVFIYVGALEPVFAALVPRLRPGAQLCFSVEESEGEALALRPSLRYAHSEASIAQLAAAHGLQLAHLLRGPIRIDQGQPVAGLFAWMARR
ncbi:tetratricopeptide repeat protein [Ramlibacter sp. AW1]|uniref:Tetratricopeptide repeat protein n=1 Tax=Ramlibacter aurantiacus TaxID=2801330 RepID=A0A937D7E7_9BURK|nr:tetratricopeptide repeat protein [Ramlibacter aurantiacus]MBL0423247.1 tetratricopeptide repeat protein [Ramlibacter aurantiacus]